MKPPEATTFGCLLSTLRLCASSLVRLHSAATTSGHGRRTAQLARRASRRNGGRLLAFSGCLAMATADGVSTGRLRRARDRAAAGRRSSAEVAALIDSGRVATLDGRYIVAPAKRSACCARCERGSRLTWSSRTRAAFRAAAATFRSETRVAAGRVDRDPRRVARRAVLLVPLLGRAEMSPALATTARLDPVRLVFLATPGPGGGGGRRRPPPADAPRAGAARRAAASEQPGAAAGARAGAAAGNAAAAATAGPAPQAPVASSPADAETKPGSSRNHRRGLGGPGAAARRRNWAGTGLGAGEGNGIGEGSGGGTGGGPYRRAAASSRQACCAR